MRAKVTLAFPGRPDDEIMTRTIGEGEIVEGDLAVVAVREGWAKPQKGENAAAEETSAERDPLDHDGDGRKGGSLPRRKNARQRGK
ncbi:hypothetical protein [Filomicrobium sp.]|uniref:hypothetical protein n=1 Tax=Filomicrobium sp. TaxID=2024831 RepID=UPI00258F6F1F|nr:hypothetical protein [Filomicrobium sp.]MCV0371080.1 hypothetical protein [Filomicrobium sp.]